MKIELRPYQQECVDTIDSLENGSHLVSVATGLGKTVIFSQLKRRGRTLILSHRDELVHQPQKYYDCSFGVEQASEHSNGEEVISASVQSLVRRLHNFSPNDFDMIITDEAHHAAAPSYKKIYGYFNPRIHIGFTATPKRGDKVRLNDVYNDIIFTRDLKWGIDNGYLSDINCLRVNLGYDLSDVKKKNGDFDTKQLSLSVNRPEINQVVAQAYKELAVGQTLIFAADVAHANALSAVIDGSVVVSGKTPSDVRKQIISDFTERKIPCIINCMVFTEGTDMPLIETVIVARPTVNTSLYTQMVGRGLRLSKGKKFLTLIDCVGASGRNKLCTAPTLLGLDYSAVPPNKQNKVIGMLTQMQDTIELLICDGSFTCSLGRGLKLVVEAADNLGKTTAYIQKNQYSMPLVIEKDIPLQDAIDTAYEYLSNNYQNSKMLWDKELAMRWGKNPISRKQIELINRLKDNFKNRRKYDFEDFDTDVLNQFEASIVIDRLMER